MSLVALLLIDKFDRKPNDLYGVLYLLTQYVGVLQCSRLLNEIELIARIVFKQFRPLLFLHAFVEALQADVVELLRILVDLGRAALGVLPVLERMIHIASQRADIALQQRPILL